MQNDLPKGITIGDLICSLQLKIIEPIDSLPGVEGLSIGILNLEGKEEHVLPFVGCTIQIKPFNKVHQSIVFEITGQLYHDETVSLKTKQFFAESNFTWPDFCLNVEGWLAMELGRVLVACEECFQMLTRSLSNQQREAGISALKTILGYDVFLLDNQLDVLEWAGGEKWPLKPIPFMIPKFTRQAETESSPVWDNLRRGYWKDEALKDLPLTWYPMFSQRGLLGYLGLAVSILEIKSIEKFFLDKAVSLFTLELLKNYSVQENERLHHRDFLFDLLYNNFDSLDLIISRGKLWGWDFNKPHLVIVGEIENLTSIPMERQLLEELIVYFGRTFRNLLPGSICLDRNEQIVILLPVEKISPSQCQGIAKHYLQIIKKTAQSVIDNRKLSFGLGNLYPTAREIHRSFQEARAALELGRLLFPDKLYTSFAELGIMRLLQRLDHQELEDFCVETLKPLLEFDSEANLQLQETLLAYFLCNGDLNQAAQRLFLHPNTLRYRLKKASEVLDKDIFRFDNQVNLFIALQISQLQALWSE